MNRIMSPKQFSGVYAALLTPRTPDGAVDANALKGLVRFLLSKGVESFAVNGATGEFCMTTAPELRLLLRAVRDAGADPTRILCGVGSSSTRESIELAAIAAADGAAALLLPMPYFFHYAQEDLDLYCRTIANTTKLPVLLYNLPQFSSGLDKDTVRRLISETENIVGIKDSSGTLDILRDLSERKVDACRIVGNDTVLAEAITERVCDGVVSGVACALPELVLSLFKHPARSEKFHRSAQLLSQFVSQLDQFPVPWALKWALDARGVIPATISYPVTERRATQARGFTSWFREWLTASGFDN